MPFVAPRSQVVILMGVANLVADAFSMGMGDYLSENAERQYIASERQREMWEFDNFREGEIAEMVEIYESKGVAKEDAKTILLTMAKYGWT